MSARGNPVGETLGATGLSRAASRARSVAGRATGPVLAVLAQVMILPVLGPQAALSHAVRLGASLTVVAILHGHALRRVVEALRLGSGVSLPLKGSSR